MASLSQTKRAIGRPTKYDPKFCQLVIDVGELGGSIAEMAYEVGVCRNTLKTWQKEYPDFLTAMTRAELASQVWWERAGRDGMTADKFNSSVWSRSMAARFPDDWREKQEVEHRGEFAVNHKAVDLTDDELAMIASGRTA